MNAKIAKFLRKTAKESTSTWAEYAEGKAPSYAFVNNKLVKIGRGTPCTLKNGCGKHLYKSLKAQF